MPSPPDPRLDPASTPAPAVNNMVASLLAADRSASFDDVIGYCDRLVDHLSTLRPADSAAEGRAVLRAAFPVLARSSLLRMAMLGPGRLCRDVRALARAAAGRATGDDDLGEAVDAWALRLPTFAALRERDAALRQVFGEDTGRPSAVTEVESVLGAHVLEEWPPSTRLTVVDSNPEVLDAMLSAVPHGLRAVRDNVMHLARGLGRIPLEPQDLVYCLDLLGYLNDRDAVRLLDWAHGRLRRGGVVLVASPRAGARDGAFLEHVAGWALRRRSPEQLSLLFSRSTLLAGPVVSWADSAGGTTYCMAHRGDE